MIESTPNQEPVRQEDIKLALIDADGCMGTDEGDLGTGAIVLAQAYRQAQKRIEELMEIVRASELDGEVSGRYLLSVDLQKSQERIEKLEALIRQKDEALKRIQSLQPQILGVIRKYGYKFTRFPRNTDEQPPQTDGEKWECMAFAIYTSLCESEVLSRSALSDLEAAKKGK